MNTKVKVKKLEALFAAKNGGQIKILIREDDESDEQCINRSQFKGLPLGKVVVISKTDERL